MLRCARAPQLARFFVFTLRRLRAGNPRAAGSEVRTARFGKRSLRRALSRGRLHRITAAGRARRLRMRERGLHNDLHMAAESPAHEVLPTSRSSI